MNITARILFLIITVTILFVEAYIPAIAQITSSGIAIPVPMSDAVVDGDIICSTEVGNVACLGEYAPSMFGVYSQNPSAEIRDDELEGSKPLITSGVTQVRVSSTNGAISEGSLITSSDIPGVGMLASRNGYVLGTAMEEYNNNDPNVVGTIAVAVNIHPAAGISSRGNNLIQFLREGLAVPLIGPLESLRYLLAIIIVLISFTLGLFYFGRVSRSGVEAIGRNPLAHKAIQMTIIMHVILSIAIILVGLVIAYLILIL